MTPVDASPGKRHQRALDTVLLAVAFVAAWQVCYKIAGSVALASPLATLRSSYELLTSADFWPDVSATLTAFVIALVIETAVGLVVGVVLGLRRLAGDVVEPILTGLYSIPKIIFYPIILLFCGIGLASEVVFGILHGIVPIIMFTASAVRNLKPVFLKTGRVLNLSFPQMMWTIALPGAFPEMFTGLRIGFAGTLIGVLLSEMFGSRQGLGFLLMNAIGTNQSTLITSLTLLLIVFAAIASGALMVIDERLHRRV
jgi:NitT/TauT family transport system permease protein